VNLRPPKLDVDSEGNGDEDEVCDELARTTFDMYFRSLFKTRDELDQFGKDNEYDSVECDTWDELTETKFIWPS
jgi:hypothetical protein